MTQIRVAIADDDDEIRAALEDLVRSDPEMEFVGAAIDAESAIEIATGAQPDVFVMDVRMPGGGGPRATREMRRHAPRTRVVALSAYEDRATILEMLGAGAVGYVAKGALAGEIVAAIVGAVEGQSTLSPEVGGVSTDIRERRRREDELRETNRALLTLIQSSPLAICSFDLEHRVLMWNPAAERMFGWTADEIVGRLYPLAPPELSEEFHRTVARVVEGSERLTGWETRGMRRDGALLDVSVAVAPLLGEDGRPTGVMVMAADITDRRRAEDTTRRLAAIVEASDDAIISADARGRITTWNGGAERMYGWRAEEVMGEPVTILYGDAPEEAERRLHDLLEAVVGNEQVVRREAVRLAKDGTPIDVTLTVFPLYDAAGTVIGVSGITHDIRAQKLAERELRRSLTTLQELDGQRRRLLARLVDAQESERRRIASDINDDSIQVMTAAGIRLDSLRRRVLDPEIANSIDELQRTVHESIGRLRHLVFELRPSGLDRGGLGAALEEILSVAEKDGGHPFELRSSLQEPIPEDQRAIAFRIAQEAIQNVRRHAPGARIEVELERRDGGILARVRDDGPGFDLPRDEAANRGDLGIAGMRERAAMAGGWLRIETEPGAGTCVEVWLPVAEA